MFVDDTEIVSKTKNENSPSFFSCLFFSWFKINNIVIYYKFCCLRMVFFSFFFYWKNKFLSLFISHFQKWNWQFLKWTNNQQENNIFFFFWINRINEWECSIRMWKSNLLIACIYITPITTRKTISTTTNNGDHRSFGLSHLLLLSVSIGFIYHTSFIICLTTITTKKDLTVVVVVVFFESFKIVNWNFFYFILFIYLSDCFFLQLK